MEYLVCVLCVVAFFVSAGARADDGAFGGKGGNVYLIDQADIEFVDEHVTIKGKKK